MQSPASAAAELQRLLTIPPPDYACSPHNAAAVAHAALQALRDSGDAHYLFIRTILELQQDAQRHEELLFHCVTCLRAVVLHKWKSLSIAYRDTVRDYMMALGLQLSMPRTIQLACYTLAVSFWKRQWNTHDGTTSTETTIRPEEEALIDQMKQPLPSMVSLSTREDLFYYIESLLQPSNPQHMALACTFLSVLIGEFSGKSAVQYRLPMEFHKRAHGAFERDGWLDTCLKLSMGALSHVVNAISENSSHVDEAVAVPVVQLTTDVIGWEFGSDAWDGGMPYSNSSKTLVRPPATWKDYLIKPNFIGAIFHVYEGVSRTHDKLAHSLRQLLLLLASLSGPVLADESQQKEFMTHLLEGSLKLLSLAASNQTNDLRELIDVLSLVSRIIANFKLSSLVVLPAMIPLLNGMASTGASLLQAHVAECEAVQGDVECMEHLDSREEALAMLLEGVVLLCDDPWLLYSSNEEKRKLAQHVLSGAIGSLYSAFMTSRIRMAKLEEHYLTVHATDLDEVREAIASGVLEEEMASVAVIGRLSLGDALNCLSPLFQACVPQLQALWNAPAGDVSPQDAACLEEIRLLIRCLCHLLTDDNSGETPVVPESIVMACQGNDAITSAIASSVQTVLSLAELQASKIAQNPADPRLSPFLATTLLWFLNRWAPAYVFPVDYSSTGAAPPSKILSVWANADSAQQVVSFCATLCLHYQCYWPQERQVLEGSQSLILALAKRGPQIRSLLVASPSFTQMVMCHCLTAGIRHNAPSSDLEAAVQAKAGGSVSLEMVRGYQRLRYEDRSSILTAILVATSDSPNETATAMMNESLGAVHSAFSSLVQALSSKLVKPDDVNAQEMACLCVEMYCGVARAGDMTEPERIIQFITPSLPHLSGLMKYYAEVLSICEGLLGLFRDYTEHFVAALDRQQSLALFTASAELLECYSSKHVASRVIHRPTSSAEADAEEEQSYSDVLSAIQLLIHLGTKDFIDICTSNPSQGVDSSQVTDVIFYGLQQIIPLMTQGLLQFPTLCTQYFSLVGFMMDTYPDKVCVLPFELFDALLESLLFGMSHLDPFVSRSSLRGIASLAKEHLKTKVLATHLAQHPDVFDKCSHRLLQEVVFQSIVWDRLEPSGMAMLPLAAVDPQRFVAVVNDLTQQVPAEQQVRLQAAFQKLVNVSVLEKVSSGGYEGRMNRVRFKKDFDLFVKEVHSFLVVK